MIKIKTVAVSYQIKLIETFNGKVPEVICGPGYYRPPGGTNLKKVTGQKIDGCVRCPKGHYGSTSGLYYYSLFNRSFSINVSIILILGRFNNVLLYGFMSFG